MDPHQRGPCPECGRRGSKRVDAPLEATLALRAELAWQSTRIFWEYNRVLLTIVVLLTIAGALTGLVFDLLLATVLSAVIGLVCLLLGPFALGKVREIMRGRS